MTAYPQARPRRLRRTAAIRRLVARTRVDPASLVLPVFALEDAREPVPIGSMPGVVQHSRDSLRAAVAEAAAAGIGGLMIFAVPRRRDPLGTGGTEPDGFLATTIRDVVAEVGTSMVVMADLCLDEFTDHGHCGVLDAAGEVDNDATLPRYAQMAVVQADAGVAMVAPSGMMDGQVGAIRAGLDAAGHHQVGILAYSAKYASAFYGPFREAVASTLAGDRRSYQQDPANLDEAVRETALDIAEGADMVMVKPAMGYLDVLRRVADTVAPLGVPVAAYQVSGEYAMISAAAERGWIDRDAAIVESLTAIRRAGADIVLTYWALAAARLLDRQA